MRKRFKFPLLFIVILITSCSLVFVSYFFLYHQSYAMSVVADYPLSINYSTGELLDKNNYENVKFSIVNSGDEDLLYTVNLINTFSKNDISYILESEEYTYEGTFETGVMTDSILIKSGETEYFSLTLDYEGNGNFEGEIKVVREITEEMKFYQTIISDNDIIYEETITEIGKETATTDEGLISLIDENGSIYYFRGDVDNNYVTFADHTWRIVKINDDGSVKLVLDSELDVLEEYYTDDYDFMSSNAYEKIVDWYDMYLSYYDSNIKETDFCNDFSIVDSTNLTYGAYNRIVNSYGSSFNCVDEEIYLKIGLLTADEVVYAGASISADNSDFYLYSENIYFTMTSALVKDDYYYPFVVEEGKISYDVKGTQSYALKPVINLVKDSYVSGSGTKDDPYMIEN